MTTVVEGPEAAKLCDWCNKRPVEREHVACRGTVRYPVCGTCHDAIKKSYGCACAACKEQRTMKKKKTTGAPLNGSAKASTPKPGKGAPIGTLGEIAKVKAAVRSEPVERRRHFEHLPVRVPDSEKLEAHAELSRLEGERLKLKSEKREVLARFREKFNALDVDIELLVEKGNDGLEKKRVECIDYLLPTNEIQTVRADTGEVLETRPARADELQESLLIAAAEGGDKGKAKGKKRPDVEPPFGSPEQEPKQTSLEATP